MLSDITADMVSVQLEEGSTIEYSRALLEEVRRLAVTGFTAFGRGGLEIGGMLYGLRVGNRLTIHAFAECPCEHSTGPAFVLSAKDRQVLAQLVRPPAGLETLGWYRTHTRRGLDLDESDRELFTQFPPQARTIGLVVKPARWGASAGAFYLRETTGEIGPRTPREFTVEPPERSLEQAPPLDAREPAPIAESEPQVQPAAFPADPEELTPPANHRWAVAAGLVAALIAVVAGAVYYRSLPPHDFGLQAYAIAPGQIRISWNRGAVPPVDGAAGALEIRDGQDDTQIPLNAGQQPLSSLTYTQKTGRIEVTLRVSRNDGAAPVEDSIEFLGPPAQSAATPPPIQPAPIQVGENGHASAPADPRSLSTAPVNVTSAAVVKKAAEPERVEPMPAPPDSTKGKFQAPEVPAKSAAQSPAVSAPPLPVSSSPAVQSALPNLIPKPQVVPAAAHPQATPAPRSGRLFWTGKLDRHAVLEISGTHASFGSIIGSWSGGPADFRVEPAEFTHDGLMIYTTDGAANGRTEPPSKSNGWNHVEFAFDPVRVGQLVVLEPPSRVNDFNRIVLRSDAKKCPVIVVDWNRR